MKFIMMVGLPGSGKSFYANKLKEKHTNTLVFSSDEYRLKVLHDETDQSNNALVFNTLYNDMTTAIANAEDDTWIIFDATNVAGKDRKRCFKRLSGVKNFDKFEKIACVMATMLTECISRDANRSRTVGQDVILKMSARFTCPSYYEGFDKIVFSDMLNLKE